MKMSGALMVKRPVGMTAEMPALPQAVEVHNGCQCEKIITALTTSPPG